MTALRLKAAGLGPLTGIQLDLGKGERAWLQGPSASGKTLVLYLAAGLLLPETGSVTLCGEPPRPGRIAMLFQNPDYQLIAPTVGADVRLNAASDEAMHATGCAALSEASVTALSPGQRRRAALAGVLAARPALALLDVPFAGMGRAEAEGLWEPVAAFLAAHRIAVLATGEPPHPQHGDTTLVVAHWHKKTARSSASTR